MEQFFDIFKNYSKLPGQQAQKYHRLVAQGITKNGYKVHTVTSLPVTRNNCDFKFLRAQKSYLGGIEYNYLPVINFPIIKNLLVILSSFFKTLSIIRKNKDCRVMCDVLNISVSTGARIAAKISRTQAVGIVTDVPEFLNSKQKKRKGRMSEKPVTKKVKDATKPKKGEEEGKKVLQKKNFDSYALLRP